MNRSPVPDPVPDDASAAGEEDPGAALDPSIPAPVPLPAGEVGKGADPTKRPPDHGGLVDRS